MQVANAISTIHDEQELVAVWREARLEPFRLNRLRYAFYQLRRPVAELLAALPPNGREEIARRIRFHPLQLVSYSTSADGATKLIFRTDAGLMLESVILRGPSARRTTICVSSQIGCAAKCQFCATGQMSQVRNLTASEILDQVVQANLLLQDEGRRVRNVVFMGMGEPLHNEEQVTQAARYLFSNYHFNLSPRRTVLSTVGVPEGMIRWAHRFPRTPVALSLHSAREDVRQRLIPLARKYSLSELRDAVNEVTHIQHGPVMIEYLLLDGINNSSDDAAELASFLRGLSVLINLIPFNPVSHAPELHAPGIREGNAFAARLREEGYVVTFRHSLGREIDAACGQLVKQLS